MLEVVTGAPFAGKSWWVESEIERREAAGEFGLLALNYTGLFAAIVPGLESQYRDQEVGDSGTPRFAGWLLAAALAQAVERELSGYVLTDSPRRAVAALEQTGARHVIEVTIAESTAHKRAEEHVELLRATTPRAAAEDGADAASRCRQMVATYFRERSQLDTVTVRRVRAPTVPPLRAITHAYRAAASARRRGDTAAVRKWLTAARDWSAAHGLPTAGIKVPA